MKIRVPLEYGVGRFFATRRTTTLRTILTPHLQFDHLDLGGDSFRARYILDTVNWYLRLRMKWLHFFLQDMIPRGSQGARSFQILNLCQK